MLTLVMVAQCTGLRDEEVLALEWEDIDFENRSMRVVRAVVHGRVKMVKTEYSEDEHPLDPGFATVLPDWKLQSEREAAAERFNTIDGHLRTTFKKEPRMTVGELRKKLEGIDPQTKVIVQWKLTTRPPTLRVGPVVAKQYSLKSSGNSRVYIRQRRITSLAIH